MDWKKYRNLTYVVVYLSIYMWGCNANLRVQCKHIHLRTLVVSGNLVVDAFHRQGDMRMYLARNRKESICNIWMATEPWSSLEMCC